MPRNKTGVSIIGLLLLVAAHPSWAQRTAKQPCKLTQLASIDLIMDGGRVLVPVSIEGNDGAMLLTFESARSVLWPAVTGALALSHKPFDGDAFWGLYNEYDKRKATRAAFIRKFEVSKVYFGSRQILVAEPLQRHAPAGELIVFGELGMDVFDFVDFELDMSRGKLNLFSHKRSCRGFGAYWTDTFATARMHGGEYLGQFFLSMELDGKRVKASIAPNEAWSTLRVDVTKRLYGFDADSAGITREQGSDPDAPTAHYRAMSLTAKGLEVASTKIQLLPPLKECSVMVLGQIGAGYDCFNTYPLHIGRNILNELRLYFATKEQMVYYTAATAGR